MSLSRLGICVFSLALACVACSGGGGGSAASPPLASGAASGGPASGKATIVIPNRTAAASSGRQPRYISASSVSVGIAVNGGAATFADVSASSTNCTSTSGGRSCTVPVSAFPGNASFVFTLYDAPNGGGNALASGTVTQAVTAGTPFTVNVSLSGIISKIAISVPPIQSGPTSVPVTVTAQDADGNTIIGAVPYTAPITLTNSDTSGALTLSTTSVTKPTDSVSLAYSGAALSSAITLSASAAGVNASNVIPASVLPLNYFPSSGSQTFTSTSTTVQTSSVFGPAPAPAPTPATTTTTQSKTSVLTPGNSFAGLVNLTASTSFSGSYDETLYSGIQSGGEVVPGYVFSQSGAGGFSYYGTILQNNVPQFAVPFVTGALTNFSPATNQSSTYSLPQFGFGYSDTYIRDAANNSTDTTSFIDGSQETTIQNADGSSTDTLVAGSGTPPASSTWLNGLPPTLSKSVATFSAISNGQISIQVTQTGVTGSNSSSSTTISASQFYPQGTGDTVTTTVGAPISASALPTMCAVGVPLTGPIVPVTFVASYYFTAALQDEQATSVVYYAPSLGEVCTVENDVDVRNTIQGGGNLFSAAPFPLSSLNFTQTVSTITTVTYLTSTGVTGSVTVNGHGRDPLQTPLGARRRHRLPHMSSLTQGAW